MKLNILIVDDEETIRRTIGDYLKEDLHHQVDQAKNSREALQKVQYNSYHLVLIDILMPGMDGLTLLARMRETHPNTPVAIITGHGDMPSAIRALRLGAIDFLTKPIRLTDIDALLARCHNLGIVSPDHTPESWPLIGQSAHITHIKQQIQQIAHAQGTTVLITGQTGTGKEVVARHIHAARSPNAPFVAINCPALTDTLLEAELFGHTKGAFTGAEKDTPGQFEMANGGTVFLDEIADLSRMAQAALLRVIETRTIRRVGSQTEIPLDICIIAATNADLAKRIKEGQFRQDLYYRIHVFTIPLLPLRERKDDILPLANHFLTHFVASRNLPARDFSPQAQNTLLQASFPGNVRELRNMVERAAILCPTPTIQAEHLHPFLTASPTTATPQPKSDADERIRILNALEKNRWNRANAARDLGIPYSTLRYRLEKYSLT